MKDNIKKQIQQEYQSLIPSNFESIVKLAVSKAIQKPTPRYFQIRIEDIILAVSLVGFSVIVYYLGFNPEYRISISMSREWMQNIGMTAGAVGIGAYMLITEYFDNKKKIYY
jgi:hypothetical protein